MIPELNFFKTSENWNKDWEDFLTRIFYNPNSAYSLQLCLVESWDGQRVIPVSGCLLFSVDKIMILLHLFTLPNFRQKGFAQKTVAKAMSIFEKSRNRILLAGVTKGSFICDFLKTLGFREINFEKEGENTILFYGKGRKTAVN